ncbi:hypothetical protein [Streptomyces sp. NPDC127084]|uniref:hypothetical protein n=1 Tax=Streptomyces sp. NPDC127084 TaxID=3347133 RepID=UPI00365247E6
MGSRTETPCGPVGPYFLEEPVRRIQHPLIVSISVAFLLGEVFFSYEFFSGFHFPSTALAAELAVFGMVVNVAAMITLSLRMALLAPLSFAATGFGFLAAGIRFHDPLYMTMGSVLVCGGLSASVLVARLAPVARDGFMRLREFSNLWEVGESSPRRRRTRLCAVHELDFDLLPLLEDTMHRYSLGDLLAETRVCCETRFVDAELQQSFPFFTGPPVQVQACLLTERFVVLLADRGAAFVGKLDQTVVNLTRSGAEDVLLIESAWLGQTPSGYLFSVDEGHSAETFVREFRTLVAAARRK